MLDAQTADVKDYLDRSIVFDNDKQTAGYCGREGRPL